MKHYVLNVWVLTQNCFFKPCLHLVFFRSSSFGAEALSIGLAPYLPFPFGGKRRRRKTSAWGVPSAGLRARARARPSPSGHLRRAAPLGACDRATEPPQAALPPAGAAPLGAGGTFSPGGYEQNNDMARFLHPSKP